jgi:L,D-transpeptidase YbiS
MTLKSSQTAIRISIGDQKLELWRKGKRVRTFPVSTSRFGLGTEEGSFRTPLGRFVVAEKIGEAQPSGTIFRARVPLKPDEPPPETEDWITSRILWLHGIDPENANTRDRYIYIHGTKHEDTIGIPDSHGCVRMRNDDVIELFRLVEEGAGVTIEE